MIGLLAEPILYHRFMISQVPWIIVWFHFYNNNKLTTTTTNWLLVWSLILSIVWLLLDPWFEQYLIQNILEAHSNSCQHMMGWSKLFWGTRGVKRIQTRQRNAKNSHVWSCCTDCWSWSNSHTQVTILISTTFWLVFADYLMDCQEIKIKSL